MKQTQQRRDFLKRIISGFAGLSVARYGFDGAFAATGSGDLALEHLTANLVQLQGAGGHIVVLHGPEGLVLVDSGASEQAEALMRLLGEQFGDAAVTALFNTHWHLPHTGANEAIGKAGAKILAHENTRLWMSTEYFVEWENRTYTPRAETALPTDTFYSSDPQPLVFELGGHTIEYGHLAEAHTDGDIYVRFVGENVIAAGDVVGGDSYPVPDYSTGGWIGGLSEATRKLIELSNADTRIVPGTGPIQTRADLEAQLEMLTTLHERVNDMMTQGKSAEEMLAEDVTQGYDERWGDPERFIENVYGGMWWGGRVRGAI